MKGVVAGAAVLLTAIVLLLMWNWRQGAEERALIGLSPSERQGVYRRDLEALHRLCPTAELQEGLSQRCRERAEFILKFPECDSQCRQFAYALLPGPER